MTNCVHCQRPILPDQPANGLDVCRHQNPTDCAVICTTCHQPFQPGEFCLDGESHYYAKHCVAATARRCAEIIDVIGDSGKQIGGTFSEGGLTLSRIALVAIRREFPAAFVRVEEVK